MTDRKPTFNEACAQLSNALQQIARVLFPVLPYLARLVLQVLISAIPAPVRRVANNDRWMNAALVVLVGSLIVFWLAVLIATYAAWI